jgi:hypothetical protein
MIEARQREDTRLFVVADQPCSRRFDGLQPRQFARR